MTYDRRTYERYDYHMSWTSAKEVCEEFGGHLVSITDAKEQAAVVSLLSGCPYGYYHIGCKDPAQSGVWSWVTGESFSYQNWDPQSPEPTRGDGEFYAAIIGIDNPNNKQVGEWIDEPDDGGTGFYALSNSGFICEYETPSVNINNKINIPSGTRVIEAESFYGSNAEYVLIPAGVTEIRSLAFAACPNLKMIKFVSGNNITVAENFVTGCSRTLVIDAPAGSTVANNIYKYRNYLAGSNG